jgi:TPR repeat protein
MKITHLLCFALSLTLLPIDRLEADDKSGVRIAVELLRNANDDAGAVRLLEEAAGKKDPEALAALGFCYANERGVARDDTRARALFEEAVALGSPTASANLGSFLVRGRGGPRDTNRGIELLTASADAGSQASALLLAEFYFSGEHNDAGEPDFLKAAQRAEPLAEQGNGAAQNLLGLLLKDGRLPDRKRAEAAFWLEQAANQGNGKAAFNLADFWGLGSEDTRSRVQALKWLIVSAQSGDPFAIRLYHEKKSRFDAAEEADAQRLAELHWRYVLKKKVPAIPPTDP